MKSFFCFFLVISISLISFGQDEGYQTIFKNSKDSTKVSGFGAVTMDFGSVNGDLALMMGGEGAVLINRSFYVGFYGRGLTTQPTYQYSKFDSRFGRNILKTQRAAFGHGGLIIGAVIAPKRPIHFGFSGKFGAGAIAVFDDYYEGYNSNYDRDYATLGPVYVVTPQVDLEMNLTRWFKFRASAGYQFVSSSSLTYFVFENSGFQEKELLNSESFSTPTFSLGFLFGWFD